MPSGQATTPIFGTANPAIECVPRAAAYAVIKDEKSRIAAVKGISSYFLPGGGSLPGETPEQTVVREIGEELAREVRLVRRIGDAVQYFHADGLNYRMEATFFEAEFASEAIGTGEHQLYWLEPEDLAGAMFHECHCWAGTQVQRG